MADVTINKAEEKMVHNGDARGALESMLTRFNRLVAGSGIFKELKTHQAYEKPSDKKRRKHREALARMRRGNRTNAVRNKRVQGVRGRRNTNTPIKVATGQRESR